MSRRRQEPCNEQQTRKGYHMKTLKLLGLLVGFLAVTAFSPGAYARSRWYHPQKGHQSFSQEMRLTMEIARAADIVERRHGASQLPLTPDLSAAQFLYTGCRYDEAIGLVSVRRTPSSICEVVEGRCLQARTGGVCMSAGKRDVKKESFWRRAIREQRASGISVRRWCGKQGLGEASFYWWRRELAQRDAEPGSMSLVPVHVMEDRPRNGDGQIEIVLTDGRRVGVHGSVDRQTLADVLAVLTAASLVEPEHRSC